MSTASSPPGTAKFAKDRPNAECAASAPGSSNSSAFLYSLRSVQCVMVVCALTLNESHA